MKPSKKAFGTYKIAKMCHVTPATVNHWIKAGKLPSFVTGGGHRRVWDADVIAFLKSHNYPVPAGVFSTGPVKILIVDDDSHQRRMLNDAIHRYFPSAEIHAAVDGFEAGHKIGVLSPSLVILDLRLPGVDGFKVCQMVREDKNAAAVRILAVSGLEEDGVKEKILAAGADDFLKKPFDGDAVAKKIAALLDIEAEAS
jgi:CheY-like chemotaxis protein